MGPTLVKKEDGVYEAVELDIDNDGRLIVEADGKVTALSAAEVSLRL